MNDFKSILANCMQHPIPSLALREVVKSMIDEGGDRSKINDELIGLLGQIAEEQVDVVLEVLDFLHGWCSPHMRI